MIERNLISRLQDAIAHTPAVALLGPRQVGKTTLALEAGQGFNSLYLDLESEQALARRATRALSGGSSRQTGHF